MLSQFHQESVTVHFSSKISIRRLLAVWHFSFSPTKKDHRRTGVNTLTFVFPDSVCCCITIFTKESVNLFYPGTKATKAASSDRLLGFHLNTTLQNSVAWFEHVREMFLLKGNDKNIAFFRYFYIFQFVLKI